MYYKDLISQIPIKTPLLICLYGELGAGKTTFAKHMNQLCNIQIIDSEVVKEDSVKLLEHVSKDQGINLQALANDSNFK